MIQLSICIATFNRAAFISATLDSILVQMVSGIEVIIVDGASPDHTADVVAPYLEKHPQVRYVREQQNSGVDRDYDKAVSYASGAYCWLMTDDDLLTSDALGRVLDAISRSPNLIVVNSTVENVDFRKILAPRLLALPEDRDYGAADGARFFTDIGKYLSFIGAVVIKRSVWLARDRAAYYGTLFVHVGVIFQDPAVSDVHVIAKPLLRIRYGNSMWSPRAFEIWMFRWPRLVWSFDSFSERDRYKVSPLQPWNQLRKLFMYRSMGIFGLAEYRTIIGQDVPPIPRMLVFSIAHFPSRLANLLSSVYCLFARQKGRMSMYDLTHSTNASSATKSLAKLMGL